MGGDKRYDCRFPIAQGILLWPELAKLAYPSSFIALHCIRKWTARSHVLNVFMVSAYAHAYFVFCVLILPVCATYEK